MNSVNLGTFQLKIASNCRKGSRSDKRILMSDYQSEYAEMKMLPVDLS